MNVVMEPSVWLQALAGGAMLGLAAAAFLLFNGRIAGISGLLGGLVLDRAQGELGWRALFLAGIVLGALAFALVGTPPSPESTPLGWVGAIAGGLLVGFGTRLGSGCTSGHGVCGIARFSKRSFAATMTFMAFGFVTVFVIRHILGAW